MCVCITMNEQSQHISINIKEDSKQYDLKDVIVANLILKTELNIPALPTIMCVISLILFFLFKQ